MAGGSGIKQVWVSNQRSLIRSSFPNSSVAGRWLFDRSPDSDKPVFQELGFSRKISKATPTRTNNPPKRNKLELDAMAGRTNAKPSPDKIKTVPKPTKAIPKGHSSDRRRLSGFGLFQDSPLFRLYTVRPRVWWSPRSRRRSKVGIQNRTRLPKRNRSSGHQYEKLTRI